MEDLTRSLAEAISTLSGKALFDELKRIHGTVVYQDVMIEYPTTNYGVQGWIDFSVPANRVVELTIDSTFGNGSIGQAIRLGMKTDFKGFTFKISVDSTNPPTNPFVFFSLFTWGEQNLTALAKRDIDFGDFRNYPEIQNGTYLIKLTDRTPWTMSTSTGVEIPTYRKDILLVKDGIAQNRPIAAYDTMASDPQWEVYYLQRTGNCFFKNVTLKRDKGCTKNIVLLRVANEDNVLIEDVTVDSFNNSPQVITGDNAIEIWDSTNIYFKDILINHVFSNESSYGYGISLNNVWNVTVENLNLPYNNPNKPTPLWGIFGNNNVNTITLKGCHLNRFDIHCYGRDAICEQCTFEAANNTTNHNFNRVSSMFGFIRFIGCNFIQFCPLRVDPDFNAFTGFDIYFDNGCTLTHRTNQNFLLDMWYLRNSNINCRPELCQKCWPNVRTDGLQISSNASTFHIYHLAENATYSPVGYLSWLNLYALSFSNSSPSLSASNKSVTFAQKVYRTMPNTSGVFVDSF